MNQYGDMKADDAKKLKELERENQRLRKVVTDQGLDMEMPREVARGKYTPRSCGAPLWWASRPTSGSLGDGPVPW